jgi:glycine/D-amino acid oxidase-like deaminating enzyme
VVGDDAGGLWVQVGDHRIEAEAVIVAAGARSGTVVPALQHALRPVREQALLTQPVKRRLAGAHRAGQGYTAWCQQADGRVAVSGCRWATPHLETGETDPSVIVPSIQAALERFVRQYIDADVAIAERWAWIWATGRDGLPLVGRMPGDARVLACTGFGSTAWSFEAAAGRDVARGLLTGASGLPNFIAAKRLSRWR